MFWLWRGGLCRSISLSDLGLRIAQVRDITSGCLCDVWGITVVAMIW